MGLRTSTNASLGAIHIPSSRGSSHGACPTAANDVHIRVRIGIEVDERRSVVSGEGDERRDLAVVDEEETDRAQQRGELAGGAGENERHAFGVREEWIALGNDGPGDIKVEVSGCRDYGIGVEDEFEKLVYAKEIGEQLVDAAVDAGAAFNGRLPVLRLLLVHLHPRLPVVPLPQKLRRPRPPLHPQVVLHPDRLALPQHVRVVDELRLPGPASDSGPRGASAIRSYELPCAAVLAWCAAARVMDRLWDWERRMLYLERTSGQGGMMAAPPMLRRYEDAIENLPTLVAYQEFDGEHQVAKVSEHSDHLPETALTSTSVRPKAPLPTRARPPHTPSPARKPHVYKQTQSSMSPAADASSLPSLTASSAHSGVKNLHGQGEAKTGRDAGYIPGPLQLRHCRLVVAEVSTFESSQQLVRTIYWPFRAHAHAYEVSEVLHGDVSAGNILDLPRQGMLCDWEMARKTALSDESQDERTEPGLT
ncbi:uncharacterized protein BXZ73DRAFT_77205 [Epithele typhae]|uniref:uncharacterized protein n=1 Tax=Epithele typhae TaxID=378194 RepID=UPI002007B79B|nr:uncharacterized protein BXZ73DRAFT_77205 [Epithele typhae]KAH9933579.1 hypothetical protein BXZ73DRAFT_77205 [Epithele typhae]